MNGVPQREVHPVLDGLTPAQTAAATQPGSALVLSGAGSGKTRTLTAAVAYRIDVRGIAASRVIAVTFTNRAAAEMAGRIRTQNRSHPSGGTVSRARFAINHHPSAVRREIFVEILRQTFQAPSERHIP